MNIRDRQGRRKRFRAALEKFLQPDGWVPTKAANTYTRKNSSSMIFEERITTKRRAQL